MADMIRFDCTACGKRLKAPPELAGRRVKCGCGRSQVVPESLPPDDGDELLTPDPPAPRPKPRTAVFVLAGLGVLVLAGAGGGLVIGLLNRKSQPVEQVNETPPPPPPPVPAPVAGGNGTPPKLPAEDHDKTAAAPAGPAAVRPIGDFAGKWRGVVPRAAVNRQEDLELTIEFDQKGEGRPDFRSPSGDFVILTGAVQARIRNDGGQYRVVLRRDWAVDLSADGKVMTWTEKGGDRVTLTRQQSSPAAGAGTGTGTGTGAAGGGSDFPALLAKGGRFWAAPDKASFGSREVTPGDRFWIRPAADEVFVADGNQLRVNFVWQLRPGQPPPAATGDTIGLELAGSGPGVRFGAYSPATGFGAGATEGRAEGTFTFEFRGEGEVIVYLVGRGRGPLSNLLRLKARSGG